MVRVFSCINATKPLSNEALGPNNGGNFASFGTIASQFHTFQGYMVAHLVEISDRRRQGTVARNRPPNYEGLRRF